MIMSHRSRFALVLVAVLAVFVAPAFALFLVNDTFDSATVGTFPSGWTYATVGTGSHYVTNSISGAPSLPNVFFNTYPDGTADLIRRSFTTVPISFDSQRPTTVSFDLRIDSITGGSAGFIMALGNLANGNTANNLTMRLLTDTNGTWQVFNPVAYRGQSTGVWYNIRLDIVQTNTATSSGYVQYYLDGTPFLSTNWTAFSGPRTNINYLSFLNGGPSSSVWFLDNLTISVIPEPSTLLLVGVGGWLLWRVRGRGRL
jgi:hypothetical protein